MSKNFPKLMSDPKPQAQEAQKIPTSTNNEKKNKPQKNLNKLHYHIQTAENQKQREKS